MSQKTYRSRSAQGCRLRGLALGLIMCVSVVTLPALGKSAVRNSGPTGRTPAAAGSSTTVLAAAERTATGARTSDAIPDGAGKTADVPHDNTKLAARGESRRAVSQSTQPRPPEKSGDSAAKARRVLELRKLGAMSVGLPNTGFLVNGVRMPESEDWVITMPTHGFATEETVRQLGQCIRATRSAHPESPRVMLGSLSAAQGGKLPPHKSHRTGRDADVYFFRKPGSVWSKAATAQDIDLPRTWSLLRCFVTSADVDMVLIDRKVQLWLQRYALSIGEPPEWVHALFHDRPHTKSALVRHVPGHVAHMHVRFVSANARRLGVKHYHALVAAGLLEERVEQVKHRVVKGDTLLGLSRRYKIPVEEIRALNQLKGSVIRLDQVLVMKQGVPIEGVQAPIYAPGRSLPPEPCEPGPRACHAGLALEGHPGLAPLVGEDAPDGLEVFSASLR